MKSTKTLKISIQFTFIVLLISFSNIQFSSTSTYKASYTQIIGNFDKLRSSSSWILPNIYITNWSIANVSYDWCNYENGYFIIENVSITGLDGINGIHIENTTENFIIRNCQINEGIALIRVSNGHIVNNSISFGQAYPTHTVIEIGVYMGHCFNSSIENNFINGTTDWLMNALMFYICSDITIQGNIISNNDYYGFISSIGLEIQGCEKLIVFNNTILDSDFGIRTTPSYLCEFNRNRITNCICGIKTSGNYHTIAYNIIKFNDEYGISSIGQNNSIIYNQLSYGGIGIMAQATHSIFLNNNIEEYIEYGLYFEENNHNKISNNKIQPAIKFGIYLENSNNNSIKENYIKYKIACIREVNCDGNYIIDNTCVKVSEPPYTYYLFLVLGVIIIATVFITRRKLKRNKSSIP